MKKLFSVFNNSNFNNALKPLAKLFNPDQFKQDLLEKPIGALKRLSRSINTKRLPFDSNVTRFLDKAKEQIKSLDADQDFSTGIKRLANNPTLKQLAGKLYTDIQAALGLHTAV